MFPIIKLKKKKKCTAIKTLFSCAMAGVSEKGKWHSRSKNTALGIFISPLHLQCLRKCYGKNATKLVRLGKNSIDHILIILGGVVISGSWKTLFSHLQASRNTQDNILQFLLKDCKSNFWRKWNYSFWTKCEPIMGKPLTPVLGHYRYLH